MTAGNNEYVPGESFRRFIPCWENCGSVISAQTSDKGAYTTRKTILRT